MKSRLCSLLLLILLMACSIMNLDAQRIEGLPHWITVAGQTDGYAVCYFRRTLNLSASDLPSQWLVDVSADNRYNLYVNGQWLSAGPARSDRLHWNYETIDIAPYLHAGQNVISAQVWNQGSFRAMANLSVQTGFYLKSHGDPAFPLHTDDRWLCTVDPAYAPCSCPLQQMSYLVTGPGEKVDLARRIDDWMTPECDTTRWQHAQIIFVGIPHDFSGYSFTERWILQPSTLPQMERRPEPPMQTRRLSGCRVSKEGWTIPAHTDAEILFDQTYLTNAYFGLSLSGGRGSMVSIGYQESLYEEYPRKGNRNEVDGKQFVGRQDSLLVDGSADCRYQTLDWRTFRYVQLLIHTADDPLRISDISATFTGYPMEHASTLQTSDTELQQILQTGWRTTRLCAAETFMDCPYYEQLQYLGDSRIQALISLYNVTDQRLVRRLLRQGDLSRIPEGLTQSRYPTADVQLIPPFAVCYLLSLHDYMMMGSDPQLVAELLPGSRSVIEYFHHYQQADGRLRGVPFWNFIDWATGGGDAWLNGAPQPGADSCNAVLDMHLLLGLLTAQSLERHLGLPDLVRLYQQRIDQLRASIQRAYYDVQRGLYSDHAGHDTYSQHAQALAILTGMVEGSDALRLARAIEGDASLTQASTYWQFYTQQAMVQAGLGDDYLTWLGSWRQNLALGLTTWAETSDVASARSDCHAFAASPNIMAYRCMLGIESAAPGFRSARISPHLCGLDHLAGSIPHPRGEIAVSYQMLGTLLTGTISLPDSIDGELTWQGQSLQLHPGRNDFRLSPATTSADSTPRLVALTFDDGPNLNATPAVLAKLHKHGVPATFFVIGDYINPESEIMMRLAHDMGCEIGNHSRSHSHMPELSAQQIRDEIDYTSRRIADITGQEVTLFRPPYIEISDTMWQEIGLTFICGTNCEDWNPDVTPQERAQRQLDQVHDGGILLMHDFYGNMLTPEALDILIPALKAQGYELVTVSELFRRKGITPQHGHIYTNVLTD